MALGELIASDETNLNFYWKYSGLSTTLLGSFAFPSEMDGSQKHLAIDISGNLINSCRNGFIYHHSGISDVLFGSFAEPASTILDITTDSLNDLWSSSFTTGFIYHHSGISDVLLGSFAADGTSKYGIIIDKSINRLYHHSINFFPTKGVLYTHSGLGSSVLGSSLFPFTDDMRYALDLNNNLIVTSNTRGYFYKCSGISTVFTGSIKQQGGNTHPHGLVIDLGFSQSYIQAIEDAITPVDVTYAQQFIDNKLFLDTVSVSDSISINKVATPGQVYIRFTVT